MGEFSALCMHKGLLLPLWAAQWSFRRWEEVPWYLDMLTEVPIGGNMIRVRNRPDKEVISYLFRVHCSWVWCCIWNYLVKGHCCCCGVTPFLTRPQHLM